MTETAQKETTNGTSAALLEAAPVPSPNIEGETEQPIQRTVTTVDKINVKAKRGPGRPAGSGSAQLATRPARDKCAVLIDSAVGDPSFRITCEKRSPDLKQIGDEIPQGPMSDIQSFLEHKYGSGSYRLQVMQDGIVIPPLEGGSCEIRIASKSTESEVSTTIKEQSDKVKTAKLKAAEAEADAEYKRTLRRIEKEEADAKREAKDAEVSPVLAELAALKEKLEEATKPKQSEWTIEKVAMLITAAAPLLQMFIPKKDDSIKEVLQTINQTNKETNEKLIKLLETKSEKKSDEFGLFEIFNRIKKDLREEQKVMDDRLEKILAARGGDEDDDIDPNNVWGSLMALGVKGIVKFVKSGQAGAAVTEAITRISAEAGKKPEELTASDEPAIQRALATAAAEDQARKAAPQRSAIAPSVPRAPVQLPPPIRLMQRPIQRVQPGPTAQAQQQPPALTPAVGPVFERPKDETFPAELAQATNAKHPDIAVSAPVVGSEPAAAEPVAVVAGFKLENPKLQEDLALEVNAAVDDMIIDCQSGRVLRGSALVWVDNALDRLNSDFLKYLATLGNHMEVLKEFRAQASPEKLKLLDEAMVAEEEKIEKEKPGEKRYLWNNFFNSFAVLVRAFQEREKERK